LRLKCIRAAVNSASSRVRAEDLSNASFFIERVVVAVDCGSDHKQLLSYRAQNSENRLGHVARGPEVQELAVREDHVDRHENATVGQVRAAGGTTRGRPACDPARFGENQRRRRRHIFARRASAEHDDRRHRGQVHVVKAHGRASVACAKNDEAGDR